jgi:predicted RNA binding protein YcfA (HicA-like mRNA interferase family)
VILAHGALLYTVCNVSSFRFDEFITLLEAFGFMLDRVRGSHYIFVHPNLEEQLSIQPKGGGKAKPYQLRQFFKLIEAYDLELNEDGE